VLRYVSALESTMIHTHDQMMSTAGEGLLRSEVGDHLQTSLSWYVTRPTQPPPSTGWEMSGQGVIAVLSGHKGISTEGLNGLRQGDECSSMASFYFYISTIYNSLQDFGPVNHVTAE